MQKISLQIIHGLVHSEAKVAYNAKNQPSNNTWHILLGEKVTEMPGIAKMFNVAACFDICYAL